jgi:hypothetical protein
MINPKCKCTKCFANSDNENQSLLNMIMYKLASTHGNDTYRIAGAGHVLYIIATADASGYKIVHWEEAS